jgi:putative alpha-1,2-mannosidase
MLIGSPLFEKTVMHLPGGDFTVEAEGNSEECVFVQKAYLNDVEIYRSYLKMNEFSEGGTLRLVMGEEPSDFGNIQRPPSFKP